MYNVTIICDSRGVGVCQFVTGRGGGARNDQKERYVICEQRLNPLNIRWNLWHFLTTLNSINSF